MKTLGELLLLIFRGLGRLVWFIVRLLAKLAVRPFHPLLAAVGYLTIIPTGRWAGVRHALARAPGVFWLVGLIGGAVVGAVAYCLPHLWQDLPAAALAVVLMTIVTRGLGLRGLGSTADMLAQTPPRQAGPAGLGISPGGPIAMGRPIGSGVTAAGATALACALLLKTAALASADSLLRWRAVILIVLAGRCALAVGLIWLRFDRDLDRPDKVWFRRRSTVSAAVCGAWSAAVLVAAGWWLSGDRAIPRWDAIRTWSNWTHLSWYRDGFQGIAAAAIGLLAACLAAWWLSRRPAGRRVEALHAVGEIAEVVTALVLVTYEIWAFFGGAPLLPQDPEAQFFYTPG